MVVTVILANLEFLMVVFPWIRTQAVTLTNDIATVSLIHCKNNYCIHVSRRAHNLCFHRAVSRSQVCNSAKQDLLNRFAYGGS